MNKNPKVDAYMKNLENPLKEIWDQIRQIILSVNNNLEEDIKWGAPTFIYKGNIATFNPRAKKFRARARTIPQLPFFCEDGEIY